MSFKKTAPPEVVPNGGGGGWGVGGVTTGLFRHVICTLH